MLSYWVWINTISGGISGDGLAVTVTIPEQRLNSGILETSDTQVPTLFCDWGVVKAAPARREVWKTFREVDLSPLSTTCHSLAFLSFIPLRNLSTGSVHPEQRDPGVCSSVLG